MPRRKPWNGNPPNNPAAARRYLLDIAKDCVERLGMAKASLSDVAEAAGVTRQTVYRYFDDADDLFRSAAVLAGGGFHGKLRKRALRRSTVAERIVENVVQSVMHIPDDPHLSAITADPELFNIATILQLGFVQDEMVAMAGGELALRKRDRDELAELLLRLLQSFLTDPGVARTERELRAFLQRWLVPIIDARLG